MRIRPAILEDIPALKIIRDNVRENALVTLRIEHADYVKAFTEEGHAWTCEARVASVNVQLRVVSSESGVADAPQAYPGFDGVAVTPTDQRLRRTYATVVALRNLLP